MKLNEVTAEYEKSLQRSCEGMENAWDDRLRMMNNIVARIINFQESFLAEQLMNVLGVSRILDESGGKEWGGVSGIEPFVPKGHVRHYEGELQRKFKVMKERMWFRLVGSSLEVYSMKKPKEDDPLYVVTETPLSVHEVRGVTKVSDVNFRVAISSGDGGLNLFAADAADGQSWCDALARASEWDQLSSSTKAAGVAPGGEAGVPADEVAATAAAVAAVAAAMAAETKDGVSNGKGKKGKKGKKGSKGMPSMGFGDDDRMPDLLNRNGSMGSGLGGMPHNMGMMGGGASAGFPLGMMGGSGHNLSASTHSMSAAGSQMGDPRLLRGGGSSMGQPPMGDPLMGGGGGGQMGMGGRSASRGAPPSMGSAP
ncbi:unnamed protein product, partial [Laminaria digitata]